MEERDDNKPKMKVWTIHENKKDNGAYDTKQREARNINVSAAYGSQKDNDEIERMNAWMERRDKKDSGDYGYMDVLMKNEVKGEGKKDYTSYYYLFMAVAVLVVAGPRTPEIAICGAAGIFLGFWLERKVGGIFAVKTRRSRYRNRYGRVKYGGGGSVGMTTGIVAGLIVGFLLSCIRRPLFIK